MLFDSTMDPDTKLPDPLSMKRTKSAALKERWVTFGKGWWSKIYMTITGLTGDVVLNTAPPEKIKWFSHWSHIVGFVVFLTFTLGYGAVCILGFVKGDVNRLTSSVDMFGFQCGTMNTWNGTQVDLRSTANLYRLNTFDMLTLNSFAYVFAKGICVDTCPSAEDVCGLPGLPCTSNNQFRCPYYRFAPDGLYKTLPPNVTTLETSYFKALASTNQSTCTAATQGVPAFYNQFKSSFVKAGSTGAKLCGESYQLSSQYPGEGPCYPVFSRTIDYLNRCIPIPSRDILNSLSSYLRSNSSQGSALSPGADQSENNGQTTRRYMNDFKRAWAVFLVQGILAPAILSFCWILLLSHFPSATMYGGCWLTAILVIVAGLLCLDKAGKFNSGNSIGKTFGALFPGVTDPTARDRKLWMASAIIVLVAGVLIIVLNIALRKAMLLVVDALKASNRAIRSRPVLHLFCIPAFLLFVGVTYLYIYASFFLFSTASTIPVYRNSTTLPPASTRAVNPYIYLNSTFQTGGLTPPPPYTPPASEGPELACAYDPDCGWQVNYDSTLSGLMGIILFGWWLFNEFIMEILAITVTYAMSHVYFVNEDGSRGEVRSLGSSFVNSIKSIPLLCVSSFANSIIDWFVFIRPLFEVIDQFVTAPLRRLNVTNKILKVLVAIASFFLWFIEVVLIYIDRDGYVLAALHNIGYGKGCRRVFRLMAGNDELTHDIMGRYDLLITIQKLGIVAASAVIGLSMTDANYYLDPLHHPQTFLTNPWISVAFAALASFQMTEYFSQVTEITTELIILQFYTDCMDNDGKPTHSDPLLVAALRAADERERVGKLEDPEPALADVKV